MQYSNMTAYISSTSICRYISTFSTCALKLSIGNKKKHYLKSFCNECLQGCFREVIHNNYTLYYFVYMYTQICMKTHSSGVFPDGCSGHLPREILLRGGTY